MHVCMYVLYVCMYVCTVYMYVRGCTLIYQVLLIFVLSQTRHTKYSTAQIKLDTLTHISLPETRLIFKFTRDLVAGA